MSSVVLTARRPGLRVALPDLTPLHWGLVVMAIVLTGVSTAILTTSDPLWWHLHFSRLGMFPDASGAVFNATLTLAGLAVLAFTQRLHGDLLRLHRHAPQRGAATTTRVLLSVLGTNLSLAGCIPLTVNELMHNVVAYGMVAGFGGVLLTTPWMLRSLHRRVRRTTIGVLCYLAVAGTLFACGIINAAAFEAVAFTAMFGWSGVFVRALSVALRELSATPTRDAAPVATPARRHRPLRRTAPRPVRRRAATRPLPRVAASAARARLPRGCTASAAPGASARSMTRDRR